MAYPIRKTTPQTAGILPWNELLFLLEQMNSSFADVRDGMRRLKKEYRETVKKSLLILYTKLVRSSSVPRALYWARLLKSFKGSTSEKPHPRYVHLAGKLTVHSISAFAKDYKHRELYFDFDRRRTSLNDAHSGLSDASERLWKILDGRYHPRPHLFSTYQPVTPPPVPPMSTTPALVHLPSYAPRLLAHAWHLVHEISVSELQLLELVDLQRRSPTHPAYSLAFNRDDFHPFGRLRWLDTGGRCVDMTSRGMRECRPPSALRGILKDFDFERRQLACHHQALVDVFHRLTSIVSNALRAFREKIDEAAARPAPGSEILPLDPRQEAPLGAGQIRLGLAGDELL